ncbi:MAG TPA: phage/plasmid primase, P4 family [Nitrososphaeraceae archaeon]|jgi:P4 family phage/plasmid primase-like protien
MAAEDKFSQEENKRFHDAFDRSSYIDEVLKMIKDISNPQSFDSRHEASRYHNAFADFWRYDIGVNVIPAQTKLKKISIKWSPYQNAPIPESQHIAWKNSGAFMDGMAIIAGKVWHRPEKANQYFTLIDLDKQDAIREFCTLNGKSISLEEIAERFIVEQHIDDRNRAHIYFYSPIPFPKKSTDSKTGIEVKSLGEHGLSYCAPSVHQNKDQNDSSEYQYQLVKIILPVTLERNQALDMMHHLDLICLKNGVDYLHKDHKHNKLNSIVKSLKIDSTVEIGEGERHYSLLSAADSLLFRYKNKGKSEVWLKNFLSEINQQLCHPQPLPDDEFNDIWTSALEYVNRLKSDPSEASPKDDKKDIIESTSEHLKDKYRFAALPSKELLYYKDGVYVTGGEIIIEKEAEQICGYEICNQELSEIKGHLTRSCYRNREDFDKDLNIINMKNGLYNFQTGEFRGHSPDYLSIIQTPVTYNPEARPKRFGTFLKEVNYPTEIRTAVETMAYTLLRDNPYEIITILFGYGGNGKSVFTGVLTSLHGMQNVSNVPLRAMINNTFALSDLEGKNVNIDTELSSTSIEDTAIIKKLTGRQPIRIERKNQRAYDTVLHAKLFFSANKIPITHDTSDAYFRRNNIISFPNNFEAKDDPELLSKLTTDEELSGIFNVLMIALRRILKINRGIFMNEKTIHERREKYEVVLDPVGSFVDLAIAKDSIETDRVIKDDLYRAYRRFCKEKRLAIESKENFGKILKKQFRFQDGREASGARRTVWKGVRLVGIFILDDEQQMLAA